LPASPEDTRGGVPARTVDKVSGDSNVVKLIVQVVEKQEQRARLRKVH
jgi:hypothetical protein